MQTLCLHIQAKSSTTKSNVGQTTLPMTSNVSSVCVDSFDHFIAITVWIYFFTNRRKRCSFASLLYPVLAFWKGVKGYSSFGLRCVFVVQISLQWNMRQSCCSSLTRRARGSISSADCRCHAGGCSHAPLKSSSSPRLCVLHAVCWHSDRKSGWSTSEAVSLYVLRRHSAQVSALFSTFSLSLCGCVIERLV